MREPGTVFISRWLKDLLTYRSFGAVILAWALASACLCPYLYGIYNANLFQAAGNATKAAKVEFFYALWTVHATILGIFLVLLAFVFQFTSLRLAYETSLLPFLAKKSNLLEIITANFAFIALEMFQGLVGEQSRWQLAFRWVAMSGLIFALLSAVYLLYRLVDLLSPEAVEDGLLELVKRDLIKEIEEERFLAIAQSLLQYECSKRSLEYSIFDLHNTKPPIYSQIEARIVDIRLDHLATAAKHLKGAIKIDKGMPVRGIILRKIGDEVTSDASPLARIPNADHDDTNQRRIRSVFVLAEL